MWNYFVSQLSFGLEPVVGVGLIGIYFCWMIGMALKRIRQGEHMHH